MLKKNVIADLFVERRRSGLKKIKDDFVNAFNYTEDKSVEFFSDFNGFKVVMKNLNYDFIKNLNNRESTIKTEIKKRKILEVQIQKIMEFFETNDELTRLKLEKLLNVKESRARDLLRYLVKNDMLQKLGATRNIRYIKTIGKNQS
jgi:putative glutamyl-tRNA(gln) amidotransferase subunit C